MMRSVYVFPPALNLEQIDIKVIKLTGCYEASMYSCVFNKHLCRKQYVVFSLSWQTTYASPYLAIVNTASLSN